MTAFFAMSVYRHLLLNGLPDLLKDVPWAAGKCMWFMHDGAPAHISHAVQDVPNITYHNCWTEDPLCGL